MSLAYSLRLSTRQLAALLAGLETNFGQAILESVADVTFVAVARPPDSFHFDDGFDPNQSERGRAFGEHVELRWRRRGDYFLSLIISETPLTLAAELEQEIGGFGEARLLERVDTLEARMWGEWQDPREETDLADSDRHWWYEERIPRFLGYPWDSPDKALALEVVRYRVSPDGRAVSSFNDFVYRFVGLRPATAAGPGPETQGERP
ncbi:MAG TPA: hypothetical protein VJH03_22080 [Blastocatellia bacterium]|nr:hypothetical protein [Blastocatellia bacterium]